MNPMTTTPENTTRANTGHEPKSDFRSQLTHIINCASKENGSNTPDFILAIYLEDCLSAFDKVVKWRNAWYNPPTDEVPPLADSEGGN